MKNDFQELTALYALDILDEVDSRYIEEAITEFPDLEIELAGFQEAVTVIGYSASVVPMASNLKERLFQRINTESPTADIPVSIAELKEKAANVQWESYPLPGVTVGKLYQDNNKREIACFVRSIASVCFPKHQHADNEEIVVLEGDLVIDGQVYHSGDRIYSLPHTVHQPATQTGCLLFLKTSLDDVIIQ
jgi:anti-sigma factor ChrR (cupin superfamily)